jgi:8-oxo-dGTP pyrophosphatase MutT (NUDIX family)
MADAKVETLCDNEWLSLKKMVDPDNGINGCVYSHEERCNGNIIAILPFRTIDVKEHNVSELEFLVRREVCPCWDRLRQITCSITGGLEKGQTPIQCALNELWEEAGYKVEEKDMIFVGNCFASKSSDTKYHLYIVNLTDKEKEGKAEGDGSSLEAKAECYWSDLSNIQDIWDPIVSTMFARFMRVLSNYEGQEKEEK